MDYREIRDAEEWDDLVRTHGGHPMQAWGWGALKEQTGEWEARHVVCEDNGTFVGAGQVIVRSLPFPFNHICYAPRGPVVDGPEQLATAADALAAWCKQEVGGVSLKIDPPFTAQQAALSKDWVSGSEILIPKTAIIDLAPEEDDIMKGLHSKKARQYIRKAGRNGVTVRPAEKGDLDAILGIYRTTAEEDDFFIHEDDYYRTAFTACADVNQVFVAESEGEVQAFLWNIVTPACAFELWGGVTESGKTSRANFLLKWEAICTAKRSGTALYDMNGLLNDGISRFKTNFQNDPTLFMGTWDRPLSAKYGLWEGSLKLYRRFFK